MDQIDNGNITVSNISQKIKMMRILIQQLIKERDDDFTSEKEGTEITREIFKVQVRLNNYNFKIHFWRNNIKK